MKERKIEPNEKNPEYVVKSTSQTNQVLRKEGSSRFVEITNTMFDKERVMANFVVYDTNKPQGNRITQKITVYLNFGRALLFCENVLDGTFKKKVAEAIIARLQGLGAQLMAIAKQTEAAGNAKDAKKYNKLIERCKNAINFKDVDDLEKLYKEVLAVPGITPVQGADAPLFIEMGGTSAEKLKAQDKARPDGAAESRQFKLMIGSKKRYLLTAESGPGKSNEKGLIVPTYKGKADVNILVGMDEDEIKEFALKLKMHINSFTSAKYTRTLFNDIEDFLKSIMDFFKKGHGDDLIETNFVHKESTVISVSSDEMPEEKITTRKTSEPTDEEINKYLEVADDDLPF